MSLVPGYSQEEYRLPPQGLWFSGALNPLQTDGLPPNLPMATESRHHPPPPTSKMGCTVNVFPLMCCQERHVQDIILARISILFSDEEEEGT